MNPEALSLGEIGVIGSVSVVLLCAWTFASGVIKDRRAARRRMDDRKTEAWQREAAARVNHDLTTSARRRA